MVLVKPCVISDQTLLRVHLTDISISKMSKHVKDHEVKIKSQVSWRKLILCQIEELKMCIDLQIDPLVEVYSGENLTSICA